MKKRTIRRLAATWLQRSADDDETVRRPSASEVKDIVKMMARTRRNCAWELLRLLDAVEKANPSVEGLTRPGADGQSA